MFGRLFNFLAIALLSIIGATLLLVVLVASVNPSLAQESPLHKSLAVELNNVRVDSALRQIGLAGEVEFSYNPGIIPVENRVSISSPKTTVKDALEKVLADQSVSYEVVSDQIILKKDTLRLPPPPVTLSLRGKVTDSETGEGLSYIHVNLAGTMRGTYTNEQGYFEIPGLKPGKYEVMFSSIGFKAVNHEMKVLPGEANYLPVSLDPFIYELDEVVIRGMDEDVWQAHYDKFLELFFGHTNNSRKCRILNPEVLMFEVDEETGSFEAFAQDLLKIENQALGYRISYLLEDFRMGDGFIYYSGKPKFDELTSRSKWKQRKWEKNRRKAYNGSLRHFFYSMNTGQLKEEGFKTYKIIVPDGRSSRNELSEIFLNDYKSLKDAGYIQIIYTNEVQDTRYMSWAEASVGDPSGASHQRHFSTYQTSWLRLNNLDNPLLYSNGTYDPDAVTVYGYWSWERVAELIPIEYRPDK
ncbi:carboxypeptidase-like regulatory domain-containing protein [Roseivirga sp. BDSF3-8]|uniref:carboxypeptidase-like regulatory domain-containing protein n=1 Tax=Roseivirga sp. BDSF3-8 TaxID=3241598 RepID=UPI00353262FE